MRSFYENVLVIGILKSDCDMIFPLSIFQVRIVSGLNWAILATVWRLYVPSAYCVTDDMGTLAIYSI